jgi:capsular polysaccharide biosynthesis protein
VGSYLSTQSKIIKSRPILRKALDFPRIGQLRLFAKVERPVEFLQEELSVQIDANGDIVTVSLESTDPHEAASIVNGVVEA